MTSNFPSRFRRQRGFSLVELLIAIVLLIVGVLAVAQLVPAAIQANMRSRFDSSGLVLAERQLELITRQPIDVGGPTPGANYSFVGNLPDGAPFPYAVGRRTAVGGPMITTAGAAVVPGSTSIDWSQPGAAVSAGYRNTFILNEGTGTGSLNYETRWAVITYFTSLNGSVRPVSKLIIISVRGGLPGTVQRPATVATMISLRS